MPWVSSQADTSDLSDNCSTISRCRYAVTKENHQIYFSRGESGPSSLDSRRLEREIARERRISGGGHYDIASPVRERRVSGRGEKQNANDLSKKVVIR